MSSEELLAGIEGTLAVVGNGELARDYGALIDGHDAVIRFNAFRIEGHEARCGRRTTHWCTFGPTPHNPMPRDFRRRLQPFSPFTAEAVESAGVEPDFAARLLYARRDYRLPLFAKPSTGIMLARLVEELGHPASLFGFDGFTSGHYFDPAHVHDPNHGAAELLYLLTRPLLRVYAGGPEPVPTVDADPSALIDELTRDRGVL